MSTKSNSFPAKILLFGEYTILLGSSALSIPYHAFTAALAFPGMNEPVSSRKQVTSNQHLFEFYQYLAGLGAPISQTLDLEKFHQDLMKGLFLQSTIPAGYGIGSSGALVAAVFDRFTKNLPSREEIATDEGMLKLKTIFSEMESFFHGKSSGFDPLVSFLKRPILLRSDGVPELTNLPQAFAGCGAGIFLLDTGQTGKTAPLVKMFLERFKPEGKITEEGKILARLTKNLVHAFLEFSAPAFWDLMKMISLRQIKEFSPMIPENFTSLWLEGAERGLYYLKLCGSGGGGNLIGLAPDLKKANASLQNLGFNPVLVQDQSGGFIHHSW
jgi:mevalonate kinase